MAGKSAIQSSTRPLQEDGLADRTALPAEPGGKRKPYGGTLSQGIKRGTLVHHPKWGKAYVGGQPSGRVSLHDPHTGKRLTRGAKMTDCRVIKLLRWRTRLVPFSSTQTPRKERVFPPVA